MQHAWPDQPRALADAPVPVPLAQALEAIFGANAAISALRAAQARRLGIAAK